MKNSKSILSFILPSALFLYSYFIVRYDAIKFFLIDKIGEEKISNLYFLVAVLHLWTAIALLYILFTLNKKNFEPVKRLFNTAIIFTIIALILTPLSELILLKEKLNESTGIFSISFNSIKYFYPILLGLIIKSNIVRGNRVSPILLIWLLTAIAGVAIYFLQPGF